MSTSEELGFPQPCAPELLPTRHTTTKTLIHDIDAPSTSVSPVQRGPSARCDGLVIIDLSNGRLPSTEDQRHRRRNDHFAVCHRYSPTTSSSNPFSRQPTLLQHDAPDDSQRMTPAQMRIPLTRNSQQTLKNAASARQTGYLAIQSNGDDSFNQAPPALRDRSSTTVDATRKPCTPFRLATQITLKESTPSRGFRHRDATTTKKLTRQTDEPYYLTAWQESPSILAVE